MADPEGGPESGPLPPPFKNILDPHEVDSIGTPSNLGVYFLFTSGENFKYVVI